MLGPVGDDKFQGSHGIACACPVTSSKCDPYMFLEANCARYEAVTHDYDSHADIP